MSKNRIKVKLPTLTTRDEAESAMNTLAHWANTRRNLVTVLDSKLLKLKEDYELDIKTCDKEIEIQRDALRAWAEANPAAFGKKKSLEFTNGTIGFRTGTPKLEPISRAFTWKRITELVCEFLPAFTRSKPEVDKEAILAQRDEAAIKAILPRVGLKVVQDEGFFVEPALTETETRQTAKGGV